MMRYSEAGVRKASREETAGEFAPAAVSVYGDLAPVYALIFGLRTGTTALRNRFIIEMADSEPLQGSLLRRLWDLPSEVSRADSMPFWAGQAAPLIRELPAGQLVDRLVAEARSILGASA
jgi:hypothetical protein